MNCQAVVTKTSANPMESSGDGMVLQSFPKFGNRGPDLHTSAWTSYVGHLPSGGA